MYLTVLTNTHLLPDVYVIDDKSEEEEVSDKDTDEGEVQQEWEQEEHEKVQDEEEQESPSRGGSDEDSEDDTVDPDQVVSFVGPAQAPSGYKILDSCPSLETDGNLQELIVTQILHAWDDKDRQGLFEGTVHVRNLTKAEHVRAATADFAVQYTKTLTSGARKKTTVPRCDVAHELTSRTNGEKKWWVVIAKDE